MAYVTSSTPSSLHFQSTCTSQFSKPHKDIRKEFGALQKVRGTYVKGIYSKYSKIGRCSANHRLNRTKGVFPHDRTIVSLKNHYVNANYAFAGKYIQTEAPTKKTLTLFWSLISQEKVKTIVMLNELSEPGIIPYWPKETNRWKKYGQLSVKLLNKQETIVNGLSTGRKPAVIHTRELLLKSVRTGPARKITHIHYTNWHDGKAPRESGILKVIEKVNKAQKKNKAPIAVHCFAGVGRTGTFCTLHKGKEDIESGKPFNIKEAVAFQRSPLTGRAPYMVTEDQYVTSHNILQHIQEKYLSKQQKKKPDIVAVKQAS